MASFIDLSGQRFGKLVAESYIGRLYPRGQGRWQCKCDCGEQCVATGQELREESATHCGCVKRGPASNRMDLTGQRFSFLTVVELHSAERGHVKWSCRCDCGTFPVVVLTMRLRHGKKKSCGCMRSKMPATRKHGMTKTPEWAAWHGMQRRCYDEDNPAYANYGGRGIDVCNRWHDFTLFCEDMSPRPEGRTIDRIDNDSGYRPENCRWATPFEQQANKRNNMRITINGVTKIAAEWSRESGVDCATICCRIKSGWTPNKAVFSPARSVKLTFNGETLSIPEWSKRTGISDGRIRNRITCGWSVEQTLTQPVERSWLKRPKVIGRTIKKR